MTNPNSKFIALVPLNLETRTALPTREAALHLGRADQTLRDWACHQKGPIEPLRINGRLAWLVDDIRRILKVDDFDSAGARPAMMASVSLRDRKRKQATLREGELSC